MENKNISFIWIVIIAIALMIVVAITVLATKNSNQEESKIDSISVSDEGATVITQTNPSDKDISVEDFGFVPSSLTVLPDTSVTWTNNNIENQQIISDGNFSSDILKPGDTFTMIFDDTGSYSYYEANDPNIKGVITVSE